jgi:hypothetical protein
MWHLAGQAFLWVLTWLYYVLIICFLGAILGVVSHLLFGVFFMDDPDYAFQAAFGFSNGIRYGGVWAGGLSIVLCVMRARRDYLRQHGETESQG